MWNLKKIFVIGCTIYMHVFCCGTEAKMNMSQTSTYVNSTSTTDLGSAISSASNSCSTHFSTASLYSYSHTSVQNYTYSSLLASSNSYQTVSASSFTPVTASNHSYSNVPTSSDSFSPVLASSQSLAPVLSSSQSITPVLTSTQSITPVTTISKSVTTVPTSSQSITPLPTSFQSITPVPTISKSVTPVLTSSQSLTPVLTSSRSLTPVPTRSQTITPVPTSSKSITPVPVSSKSFTPVPTSNSQSLTPVLTSSKSITPVPTSSLQSLTPVLASSKSITPVPTSSKSVTPVLSSSNSFSPVLASSISNSILPTSSKSITPVLTSSFSFSSVPKIPSSYTSVVGSSYSYTSVPVSPAVTTNPESEHKNESHVTEETDSVLVLSKDTVPVKVELVVKIEKTFQVALTDKTSPLYKNYTTEFKTKLVEVYKTMKNFLRIDVKGFRNGSIICDYAVVLTPGSTIKSGYQESTELQGHTDILNSTNIFGTRMISPNSSIAKVFQENIKADFCYAVDCGSGYSCDKVVGDSVTCKHICATSNKCQHGGECLYDARHELPRCRCKQDSNYMYSGDYCEVKVEKFTMSKTNIIAIGAGAGGGVMLLLLVVIVTLVVKYKRRQSGKQRDGKPDPFRSVSTDDLRFETRNSSRSSDGFLKRPKIHAAENPYHSGLPDTKYVQGREHKVMKDDSGRETYLYQPTGQVKHSSGSSVASSNYSDHINQHAYDYIDTGSKFEIQRPNIRLGYLDKF